MWSVSVHQRLSEACDSSPSVSNDAPAAFPLGTTTVTWTVTDASGSTNTATQQVTLLNAAPVADDQNPAVAEDAVNHPITLTASDINNDSPLSFALVALSGPTHGTLGGAIPNLTYTPDPDYFGPDGFQFTATDEHGATSSAATVSITVTPVNDPPVDNGISRTRLPPCSTRDTIGTVTITATDVDDHPLNAQQRSTLDNGAGPVGRACRARSAPPAGMHRQYPNVNHIARTAPACSWDLTGQMLEDAGDYDIAFTVTD